jgi:hypothetical protein
MVLAGYGMPALAKMRRGHWGERLTPAEMEKCPWLKPRLAATIEYLE